MEWQEAMQQAPFGPAELQTAWPYLGVTVVCPHIRTLSVRSRARTSNAVAPAAPDIEWRTDALECAVQGMW